MLFSKLILFIINYVNFITASSYTFNQFREILRRKPYPCREFVLSTLNSRKLILGSSLLNEIDALFIRNTYTPVVLTTDNVYDSLRIESASKFCCECDDFDFNCPICKLNGKHYCEYPYHDFSNTMKTWFRDVYLPRYRLALSLAVDYSVNVGTGDYQFVKGGSLIRKNYGTKCLGLSPSYLHYSFGITLEQCTTVVRKEFDCPSATIGAKNGCDYMRTVERPLPEHNYKACFAPYLINPPIRFQLVPSAKLLCNYDSNFIDFPALYNYASLSTGSKLPPNWFPTPRGRVDNKYYFYTYSDDLLLELNHLVNTRYITSPITPTSEKQKIICSITNLHHDKQAYNGMPSWIGDVLIQRPCLKYFPFNDTSSICESAIFSPTPYCSDHIFSYLASDIVEVGVPIDTVTLQPGNFSCTKLSRAISCTFSPLVNSSISLMTENMSKIFGQLLTVYFSDLNLTVGDFSRSLEGILNKTFDSALVNLLDGLGRNDTSIPRFYTYKHTDGVKVGPLGNWFSSIFASLIEPFFRMAIDLILSVIVPIAFDAITSTIHILSELVEKLTAQLIKFLNSLADASSTLITTLLKFLIGLILFIDSVILLFEFTLVFLFIIYYFNRSWIFAVTIVIILMIIFGLERKSPSLLLSVTNYQYFYFNFSNYRSKSFNWDYSFSYTNADYYNTFYFHNQTLLKTKLY